jgi:2-dehydro-3-deoxygluconokinase
MLNIQPSGALDFLSLGAMVNRLDPGRIPFRKANQLAIHVSGGEFNCSANLSDCFQLKTGIATAMVDYPLGDLIHERVRAMGVKPFYKRLLMTACVAPTWPPFTATRGRACELRLCSTIAATKRLVC